MNQYKKEHAETLAEEHVDWFLKALRPLLIDHFVHGFKHGLEYDAAAQPAEAGPGKED